MQKWQQLKYSATETTHPRSLVFSKRRNKQEPRSQSFHHLTNLGASINAIKKVAMFSSETISRDMSRGGSFLHSNPSNEGGFKHVSGEGQLVKSRDSMGSDLFLNQAQIEQSNQQQGCGLARYRSAPSSFVASLLDSTADNSSSGDESEALFSALLNGPTPRDLNQKAGSEMHYQLKQEIGAESEARPGSMMGYESVGGAVVGSYSVGMENQLNLRMNTGNNLVRQSSSPAGFFNGYGMIGELENYRLHNHSKATSSSVSNHNISFSSTPSSSSRFMPSIPENSNDTVNGARSHETGHFFPQDSWNDASFNSLKRNRDGDMKMFSNFNGLEDQSGETRKSPHGLVHHLSLPKTASEMAEVEKFLQLQPDSVPCQIRAKRGCATHPRSIAERMRRTRISEKMKKLQDLFPNMDKQTSTADMLDLAVQFIKDLQEQVETLTETKAKCVCSRIHR